MISLSIKNSSNVTVNLTQDESVYQLISVSGLEPVRATMNMANIYGVDGTKYVNSKLNNRNIVVTVQINGDAETNRLNLYTKLPPKEKVTVYITTSLRAVYIDGYVEYINCNSFEKGMRAQISIICPYPFFIGTTVITQQGIIESASGGIMNVNPGEYPAFFDLWIVPSETPTGFTVTAYNGEKISASYSGATAFYIPRYDVYGKNLYTTNGMWGSPVTSILSALTPDSVFFLLPTGTRSITISVPGANTINYGLKYNALYGGI